MKNSFDKLGIGVDIEDIGRFRKMEFEKNKSFYKKVFTDQEIKYCLSKKDPYKHFTARFCAKEAFVKAINKPIKDYKEVEVGLKNSKPFIVWKKQKHLVSLSHEKDKAMAFVLTKVF